MLKYGSKPGEERDLRGLNMVQKQKCKCKSLHIWMSIAAGILICGLLFCCLHFHKITFHISGNPLYKDYYQKFNLYVTRGPKDYSKFKYFEGVNLYITGKYEESIGICRNLLQGDPSNMDYRFLHALTLMESGLTDQAKQVYLPLIKESIGKNAMIYAISTWHVSLIYLKEDKPDSSLFYLKTFRLEDNLFVNLHKAEELRKVLMK